ncbi:MAG: hypothetical protein ACTSSF_12790, partial [Candidatus Heimdallarchaeaceae archaeon]
MSRFLIRESVASEAEEDLIRLLLGKNLVPEKFHYSPYILRCIHEQLLEKGYSIGLGYKSEKSRIDKYWSDLTLPLTKDVLIRIIDQSTINQSYEVIVIIKDYEIKIKVWSELYNFSSIRPKNDLVFRGHIPIFNEQKLDSIIEQLIKLFESKSIDFGLERFVLTKSELKFDNITLRMFIPHNISFSCKMCNLCELPSNYSINPIPNHCFQPYCELLTYQRIGFPSNLVCVSFQELKAISDTLNYSLSDFSLPVLLVQDTCGKVI